MNKTLIKTQISCSLDSTLKTSKTLKKLVIKQKMRDVKEKVVEGIIFTAQNIKSSPQQLRPILIKLYQRIAATSLEKRTKTLTNTSVTVIITKDTLQISVPSFTNQKTSSSYNSFHVNNSC